MQGGENGITVQALAPRAPVIRKSELCRERKRADARIRKIGRGMHRKTDAEYDADAKYDAKYAAKCNAKYIAKQTRNATQIHRKTDAKYDTKCRGSIHHRKEGKSND